MVYLDQATTAFISNSKAGRYEPRKKKVRIKIGNKRQESYRLETHDEIMARVQKYQQEEELRVRRQRWKDRTTKLQEEEDIGGAFAARAEAYLADRLTEEKKQRLRART